MYRNRTDIIASLFGLLVLIRNHHYSCVQLVDIFTILYCAFLRLVTQQLMNAFCISVSKLVFLVVKMLYNQRKIRVER